MLKGFKELRDLKNLADSMKYQFKVSILQNSQINEANMLQKLENLQSEGYTILSIFPVENKGLWLVSRKPNLKGD